MPIINSYPLKAPVVAEDEALISDSETQDPRFRTRNATIEDIAKFVNRVAGTFNFSQGVPNTTWTIDHTLHKFPSVSVVNESNELVIGNIEYINKDKIIVTFSAPFSGKAYLN
mgnify:FL=1|jgi:N-acetylneuraminic acid mutarotase|tara:strand:+ start:33 stop:371 length:339 start_codon:yes stop_codon:yes gene_type:complete